MTTRGRIVRALAVVALIGAVAMAHNLTRSSAARVHKMRPILTLNAPLIFSFDGDIFAPGLEIDDSSATCSANGGNAGNGGGTGHVTGGGRRGGGGGGRGDPGGPRPPRATGGPRGGGGGAVG